MDRREGGIRRVWFSLEIVSAVLLFSAGIGNVEVPLFELPMGLTP